MDCNCKWTEVVIALVILVFSFWTTWMYSRWVVIIAALVLLIHALLCKNCNKCMDKGMSKKSGKKKR